MSQSDTHSHFFLRKYVTTIIDISDSFQVKNPHFSSRVLFFTSFPFLYMSLSQVRKRNGDLVDFDRSRIEDAILAAVTAVGESDKSFIPVVTDFIVKDLEHVYGEIFANRIPSVEDIQDIVERNLVKFNKFEVAKHYIIYRAERQEEREE